MSSVKKSSVAVGSVGDLHIHSGDYHVTADKSVTISTVLGSCIAVCLRDSVKGIGGMNHFLLPEASDTQNGASARYGAYAMEVLINDILKQGGQRKNLECKVFGGSDIGEFSTKIGSKNAEFICAYLVNENLPILAQDIGGKLPRRVRYTPGSGKAMVRSVSKDAAEIRNMSAVELSLNGRIAASLRKRDDDIVLF